MLRAQTRRIISLVKITTLFGMLGALTMRLIWMNGTRVHVQTAFTKNTVLIPPDSDYCVLMLLSTLECLH